MGKLSIGKYAKLCILGGEIAFTACMLYGFFLSGSAAAFHLSLFQLLPWFNGMNLGSWLVGAVSVAVWAGAAGSYIAWMHNVSLKQS